MGLPFVSKFINQYRWFIKNLNYVEKFKYEQITKDQIIILDLSGFMCKLLSGYNSEEFEAPEYSFQKIISKIKQMSDNSKYVLIVTDPIGSSSTKSFIKTLKQAEHKKRQQSKGSTLMFQHFKAMKNYCQLILKQHFKNVFILKSQEEADILIGSLCNNISTIRQLPKKGIEDNLTEFQQQLTDLISIQDICNSEILVISTDTDMLIHAYPFKCCYWQGDQDSLIIGTKLFWKSFMQTSNNVPKQQIGLCPFYFGCDYRTNVQKKYNPDDLKSIFEKYDETNYKQLQKDNLEEALKLKDNLENKEKIKINKKLDEFKSQIDKIKQLQKLQKDIQKAFSEEDLIEDQVNLLIEDVKQSDDQVYDEIYKVYGQDRTQYTIFEEDVQ